MNKIKERMILLTSKAGCAVESLDAVNYAKAALLLANVLETLENTIHTARGFQQPQD